jgi:hypothetical protein
MIRINKYATIQPANAESTETQAQSPATTQPQSEAVINAPTISPNSANAWQRASLERDGIAQQAKLAQSYELSKKSIEQAEEAREDKQSGALFGTIFLGPIIGTLIGNAVDADAKKREMQDMMKNKEEEIKRLQEELEEAKDNSSWETFGDWLFGSDSGQSEISQSEILMEAATKIHDPDDD